jgi:cyanate permease
MDRRLIRLRSFGQIFGYLFAVFMISVGVGPLLLGFSFDPWRSYWPMLVAFEISFLIACAIFRTSGHTVFRRTNKWEMNVRDEFLLKFSPSTKRML